jgi:hypothetical protein
MLPALARPGEALERLHRLLRNQIDEIDKLLGEKPAEATLDRAGMARLKMLKAQADAAR